MNILIRAEKSAVDAFLPEYDYLADSYSSNSGNLLYRYSVEKYLDSAGHRVIPNFSRYSPDLADWANANCQCFVLPLANAFRKDFFQNLIEITDFIEQLKIKVCIPSIGFQGRDLEDFNQFSKFEVSAIKRFVNAVLERSATIGVRGSITKLFLHEIADLQYKYIDVIGCPSLFMFNDVLKFKKLRRLSSASRMAFSFSAGLPEKIEDLFLELMKDFPQYCYIAQTRYEQGIMLEHIPEDPNFECERIFFSSRSNNIPYQEHKIAMFTDVCSWLHFLKFFDFHLSTRIHGTIAALLAGIPSCLICHDTRTMELADFFKIPFVKLQELHSKQQLLELIESFDEEKFNLNLSDKNHNFLRFLKTNCLVSDVENFNISPMWRIREKNRFRNLITYPIEFYPPTDRERILSRIAENRLVKLSKTQYKEVFYPK